MTQLLPNLSTSCMQFVVKRQLRHLNRHVLPLSRRRKNMGSLLHQTCLQRSCGPNTLSMMILHQINKTGVRHQCLPFVGRSEEFARYSTYTWCCRCCGGCSDPSMKKLASPYATVMGDSSHMGSTGCKSITCWSMFLIWVPQSCGDAWGPLSAMPSPNQDPLSPSVFRHPKGETPAIG